MSEVRTINLGRVRGVPQKDKAGKAVREIRRQVRRQFDAEEVRIGNGLNEQIWKDGAAGAPKSIDVQIIEQDDHYLVESADTDHAVVEPEPEPEPDEETSEEDDEDRAFRNIPDEVQDTLRDGSIDEGKEAVQEMNKADFELLLNFEEAHQNRKGMKKFLRSNSR